MSLRMVYKLYFVKTLQRQCQGMVMTKQKILNLRITDAHREMLKQAAIAMRLPSVSHLLLTSAEEKILQEAENSEKVKEVIEKYPAFFPEKAALPN